MLRRTAIRRALERLRSQVGESIAEVLVALLISAVGVAMLVGMIGVSTRIIDSSTKTMRKEYNKTDAKVGGEQTVTLADGSTPVDSFKVRDQVHDPDGSGSAESEITIFYTPAQAASSSTSVSGAG